MHIRFATHHDLEQIAGIYNQAVASTFMTADNEPWEAASKLSWFNAHTPNAYPLYILEDDKNLLGWLAISPYRYGRYALRFVKEVSYYVDHRYLGQGVGSTLLAHAINEAGRLHVKNYIAILLDANIRSIKLLQKFGFAQWGCMPNVADFDGLECSHVYYGLKVKKY